MLVSFFEDTLIIKVNQRWDRQFLSSCRLKVTLDATHQTRTRISAVAEGNPPTTKFTSSQTYLLRLHHHQTMDVAQDAFGTFRQQFIAATTQKHIAAREALKRGCAEQMAQLIREQKDEIEELHDDDPLTLTAKYVKLSKPAAAPIPEGQERTTDEVFDPDEDEVEIEETETRSADQEPRATATASSKKRTRAFDASSGPAFKRRSQSVISIASDDTASTSHHPLASPPASIASVASTRPQRARKPPPPREINYSKPEKVAPAPKAQSPAKQAEPEEPTSLDMPFCQHILQLISQARAAKLFLHPVDTAKYPTYYNTISQPMDLSTMAHKLENGQYKTAEEFKADFDLMIRNCLKFNPSGEVARDFGIMLDRHFAAEWNWRPEWEREVRRSGGAKK